MRTIAVLSVLVVACALYIMAADLRALGKGRTEVALYRPTMGFKNITKSLKLWVEGEDADCPKLR